MKISKRILALIEREKTVRLDLGCGRRKQPGFIGVDKVRRPDTDIVHDLEVFPWPIPSNCATTVVLSHAWEHLKPWLTLDFMAEMHRICRDGAQEMISAPYGLGARYVQDPTHCNPSNEATWGYWDNRHPLWEIYQPPVFHIEYYEIIPVGGDRDFNCILRCCKPAAGATCEHVGVSQ
jgi:hypothetical protein